jgi:hypothetical protein
VSTEPTTEDIIERLVQSETCSCSECKVAREAATLLRRHAALLDAIEAHKIARRYSATATQGEDIDLWNAAAAAAVQPPDPKDPTDD